jgi:hypothetical protein
MQEPKVQNLLGRAERLLCEEWPRSIAAALFGTPQSGNHQDGEHDQHDYRD